MNETTTRPVTEDERALLQHVSRWGSDGSPVRKSGRRWTWGPWRSVQGPPTTYRTKREATAHYEAFLDILRAALGQEACARVRAELASAEVPAGGGLCREDDCFAPATDGDRCGFHAQEQREAEFGR